MKQSNSREVKGKLILACSNSRTSFIVEQFRFTDIHHYKNCFVKNILLVILLTKGKFLKSKITIFVILCAVIGLSLGLGSFTFIYGKGYSYLQDDPKACVNCHIMKDQYDSWSKSSHKSVATCNSCHSPQEFYLKYLNKAENGFNHGWKFTSGKYRDPIRIREHNFDIAMKSCLHCHGDLMNSAQHEKPLLEGRSCVQCHRDVGHSH